MLSLIHVLDWRAAIQPGAVALTDDRGASLTYAALAAPADRAAAAFAAADVGPGDVVPVIARNGAVLRAALREPYWAGRDRRVS